MNLEDTAIDGKSRRIEELEIEIEELKERNVRLSNKAHEVNNRLQVALGTLWQTFCQQGPVEKDALNGVNISEAVHICADAYTEAREELERLRAAKAYTDAHRHGPLVTAALRVPGRIASAAKSILSR